ncbi:Gag protease polyprotein [Gossypium australe]|uniref:Gag protease polyprotein n=1 Tax=Gossypium australe TaxID=47621 RepID=A0A5B6WRG5_9ROSI|nr:Gag protease polyprotein [Gossypium australe]
MLRGCILEFQGSWEEYFPLAEFTYNNSFQSSIQMAPYESLYGSEKEVNPSCESVVAEPRHGRRPHGN